ncbi:SRPBCC family protein [Gramella sp. GC03-9]|uniref:SRPBCC family protein n=1 Tax=Christiangramia oceanisediminis TaxID=2920386 RepID=A0A9X2KZQ2_9FLAO|nr:SRPBCC family protein [Gramella oceanisediminis]MCP9201209.1 SRPBCC family protein [Gramella oceanisediminis]
MKYEQEIIINKPRNEVIAKFSDPSSLKHWQEGFIFMKPINGNLGKEGSQNLLKYKMGKREIEMTETVLTNNLPVEYTATYEAKGVYNFQRNRFLETPDNNTRWISENEFRFNGFMKLFGWFMPGAFKKQSKKYMTDFKAFVENGKSVLDS